MNSFRRLIPSSDPALVADCALSAVPTANWTPPSGNPHPSPPWGRQAKRFRFRRCRAKVIRPARPPSPIPVTFSPCSAFWS